MHLLYNMDIHMSEFKETKAFSMAVNLKLKYACYCRLTRVFFLITLRQAT